MATNLPIKNRYRDEGMNERKEIMRQTTPVYYMHPVQKAPSKLKKYFKIFSLSILLLVVAGGIFAYIGMKSVVSGMIENYTDVLPMELPRVDASEKEVALVLKRADAFLEALRDNETPPTLTMTSREINILINRHPEWQGLAGRAHVSIEDDIIISQAAFPLGKLNTHLKGRFLNGSAQLHINMMSGRLMLFMDSMEIGGKALPKAYMNSLRSKNFAEDLNKDPDKAAFLQKLSSIDVRDGRLIIVPKQQ